MLWNFAYVRIGWGGGKLNIIYFVNMFGFGKIKTSNTMWKATRHIYLDFAAAAPVSKSAARAFGRALRVYGNPSSPHTQGRAARAILENARHTIANLVEVKSDDVIFTSGATEANAIAMRGHVSALLRSGRAPKDIHILYSSAAHTSIVKTVCALTRDGIQSEPLPITAEGQVDIKALTKMIRPETALISMEAVNGEIGIIYNTREVRNMVEKITSKYGRALVHVDASQAAFAQKLTRSHWGADMLVLDAQKLGGVRGIGALIAHRTIPLVALVDGGGQERGIRPGTEPVALAAAFAAALTEVTSEREKFYIRAKAARASLCAAINAIANCVINQSKDNVPHILNISLLGRDSDYLVALLDEAGFAVSSRSACETDAGGSRAVAVFTGDKTRADSTLRVSWGPTISAHNIARFGRALAGSVTFLDEHSE